MATTTTTKHLFDRSILSSDDSSPPELNTPSPIDELIEPSILSNNVPLALYHKYSIHHQDAEASIADATDFLRMISGKMEWFHRKQRFCPHLVSNDDAKQIANIHRRILIEEIPFLELQEKLRNGMVVDIPKELEGRISTVCKKFIELKNRIDNLITNVPTTTTTLTLTTTTTNSGDLIITNINNNNNSPTTIEAVQ